MNSGIEGRSCTFKSGNSIFKLSPSLVLVDWWGPSVWASVNSADAGLGSVGPALVGASNNLVFQIGKSGWGYLLNAALSSPGGHIGNEPFSAKVCHAANSQTSANGQVFGGIAYVDPYNHVPCPEGIKALRLAAGPSFTVAWSGPSFHPGPPIVAGRGGGGGGAHNRALRGHPSQSGGTA